MQEIKLAVLRFWVESCA